MVLVKNHFFVSYKLISIKRFSSPLLELWFWLSMQRPRLIPASNSNGGGSYNYYTQKCLKCTLTKAAKKGKNAFLNVTILTLLALFHCNQRIQSEKKGRSGGWMTILNFSTNLASLSSISISKKETICFA